ncbi:MAG TPA: uroporphyrinogen decarboxylase [Bacteroidota bacterium]|nr:uroporphyrinogen decarboxylase [Bacteroidota bacterium]
MHNDLFLRALARTPVPRTPVWMMRQAGRYLPEYRAIRKSVDFLTLCKTPDLAAEVTIQPVDILEVDAAIIFSDILVVPEAMGMRLVIEEGQGGPQFPVPLRSTTAIDALAVPDPADRLRFVTDAIALTRKRLAGRVPLIGFSGSPWTLAAYMVEGHGSKNFRYAKEFIFNEPKAAHLLLSRIARTVAAYLNAQIAAGAQAVQIFDTWGGILSHECFEEFSLRYIRQVVSELDTHHVPVIVFCKDCGHSLEQIASSGCQGVGLDWTISLREARERVGNSVALQGNMDPVILYARPDRIRTEVRTILKEFGPGTGHIFNLGHGILPDVPVEHAREFIRAVKEESPVYHN